MQHSWVGIKKDETEISIKKASTFTSTKRNKFPLALAWVSTLCKVKSSNLNQGVVDFDLKKIFLDRAKYILHSVE